MTWPQNIIKAFEVSQMTTPTHSPGEVIARSLTGYVGTILTHASRMDDPAWASEAFHQIRSSCKKIRAVIHLGAAVLTPGQLQEIRSTAGKLKDIVARARDRDVLIQRLRELQGPDARDMSLKTCKLATSTSVFPLAGDLARRIREISLRNLKAQQVQLEISKTYSMAAALAQTCQKKPTDVRLHEWRKHVKTLQFQCGIFPEWKPLDVMALRASLLARMLGDHQDLVVATKFLQEKKNKKHDMLKSLATTKKHLADEALHRGRQLFCLTPWEFARGLAV